jgi:hypothetical protein
MKQISLYDYIAGNYHQMSRDDLGRVALEAIFKLYSATGSDKAEQELLKELIEEHGIEFNE